MLAHLRHFLIDPVHLAIMLVVLLALVLASIVTG